MASPANNRLYYVRHKEAIAQYNQLYYATHKAEALERQRDYLSTEKGKAAYYDAAKRKRNREQGAIGYGYTTKEMISARCILWGNRCWICGAPMQATDHVKPISRGGAHLPCNIRPICNSCNSKKRDKWPYERN